MGDEPTEFSAFEKCRYLHPLEVIQEAKLSSSQRRAMQRDPRVQLLLDPLIPVC